MSLCFDPWCTFCIWWVARSRRTCQLSGSAGWTLPLSTAPAVLGKGQQHFLGASAVKTSPDQPMQPEVLVKDVPGCRSRARPRFPWRLAASCKGCCSPFSLGLSFTPSLPTPTLWGKLMLSLFLVCWSCVSQGSGWKMAREPPSPPLPLHPLGLDVKLTVNIFVLGHAVH